MASYDVYSVDRIERLPLHVVVDARFAAVVLRNDALAERTRPIVDRTVADGSVLYCNRLMEVELAAEQDRAAVDLCAEWDRFRGLPRSSASNSMTWRMTRSHSSADIV